MPICLKYLKLKHHSPLKKKSQAYTVLWVQHVLRFLFMGSCSHVFLTLHLFLYDKKRPGFELIEVLKLSKRAQLAFHKIILLMCDILSCSFLKLSFLCNYLGQM